MSIDYNIFPLQQPIYSRLNQFFVNYFRVVQNQYMLF